MFCEYFSLNHIKYPVNSHKCFTLDHQCNFTWTAVTVTSSGYYRITSRTDLHSNV